MEKLKKNKTDVVLTEHFRTFCLVTDIGIPQKYLPLQGDYRILLSYYGTYLRNTSSIGVLKKEYFKIIWKSLVFYDFRYFCLFFPMCFPIYSDISMMCLFSYLPPFQWKLHEIKDVSCHVYNYKSSFRRLSGTYK